MCVWWAGPAGKRVSVYTWVFVCVLAVYLTQVWHVLPHSWEQPAGGTGQPATPASVTAWTEGPKVNLRAFPCDDGGGDSTSGRPGLGAESWKGGGLSASSPGSGPAPPRPEEGRDAGAPWAGLAPSVAREFSVPQKIGGESDHSKSFSVPVRGRPLKPNCCYSALPSRHLLRPIPELWPLPDPQDPLGSQASGNPSSSLLLLGEQADPQGTEGFVPAQTLLPWTAPCPWPEGCLPSSFARGDSEVSKVSQ